MTTAFLIDHVVIRVNDLDAAMGDYTELGFTVIPGGEHPGLGSHNALIAFEDGSYLELISFRDSDPRRTVPKHVRARELAASTHSAMERHWLPWATAPEGLIDFALRPSSIEEAIRDAKSRGLDLEGPIPGGRLRLDGQRVSWQLAVADSFDLPFLCADVTPRSLRVPEGEARQHRNGTTGIMYLQIAVDDLAASVAHYRALLGNELVVSLRDPSLRCFILGHSSIQLVPPPRGDSPLRDHLSEYGEGPYCLVLTARGPTGVKLDPARTHNANIHLVPPMKTSQS
jgi:catechol 2,3-dioxygenase-like lactoylglutathione lyase family enzyme